MLLTRGPTPLARPSSACSTAPGMLPNRPALAPRPRTAVVAGATGRAPSAYNLFVKAKFNELKAQIVKQGKKGTLAETTAVVRQQWAALGDKDKAPYEQESQKLKDVVAATRCGPNTNDRQPRQGGAGPAAAWWQHGGSVGGGTRLQ